MPDDNAHGTRPLRYEQLLVGRMAGVSEKDNNNNNNKGRDHNNDGEGWDHLVGGQQQQPDEEGWRRSDETTTPAPMLPCHDNTPPTPSLASSCSWGGMWVEQEMTGRGNDGEGGNDDDDTN